MNKKQYFIIRVESETGHDEADLKKRITKAVAKEVKGDSVRVEAFHDKLLCDEIKAPAANPAPEAVPEVAPASKPNKKSRRV